MKMYYNTVTDTAGNIINGATVTVYEDGGAVASIYDYAGSPISNPFQSGLNRSEGEVEFAAASGVYDIKIVNGLETDWIRNEVLFDPEEPGEIGGTTPGIINCTSLTSNGIDDNATGERVQIADTLLSIGAAGSSYPVAHAAADQNIELVGGNASGNGGAIKVYGGSHATKANDIELLSGGNICVQWDEDNGELIIYTGTGSKSEAARFYTGGNAKIEGDIVIDGGIFQKANDQSFSAFAGTAPNNGGGIVIYGASHATLAGDVYLQSGSNPFLSWDESTGQLVIATGIGAKTSAITIPSTQVVTFSQIPKVGSDDVLIDSDVGVTVQGYSSYTALYNDTTANFTGTLQNGGSNVLVDSDLGGSVQPYDADTAKTDVANTFTQNITIEKSNPILHVNSTALNPQIWFEDSGTLRTVAYWNRSVDKFYIQQYDTDGSTIRSRMSFSETGDIFVENGTFITGASRPSTDDTYDFGTISYRWQDIYATNGTIQTSDARLKDNIADVNESLAIALFEKLRPVSYKWKDYIDQDNVQHTYVRTHYGLIAQEFRQALIDIGLDPSMYGGFIHDAESDRYGVRYNELISPMISVIQSLMAKNTALEARVTATEARLDALEAI